MKLDRIVAVVSLVLVAGGARIARARTPTQFLFDGRLGMVAPVAGTGYADVFYPSPAFGVDLGAELWLRPKLGLAPELVLDGGPLVEQHSAAITTGRFRFTPGLRALFGFGSHGHAVFAELLVGGELFVYGAGGRQGAGTFNVGFATQPGGGMQFKLSQHTVAGFIVGVPIGVHRFSNNVSTSVDIAATGFFGGRW